jgi:hypothetical protein
MSLSITAVPSRDQSAVEAGVASGLFLLFRLILPTVMINDTFTTKGKRINDQVGAKTRLSPGLLQAMPYGGAVREGPT